MFNLQNSSTINFHFHKDSQRGDFSEEQTAFQVPTVACIVLNHIWTNPTGSTNLFLFSTK